MNESHTRSLVKAVSYRVISTVVMMIIGWLITRQMKLALFIGFGDAAVKIGLFYAHERLWNRLRFGRVEAPDYEI